MLIGFGLGFLMTGPRPEQLALMHAGEPSPFIGGHTVGAPAIAWPWSGMA